MTVRINPAEPVGATGGSPFVSTGWAIRKQETPPPSNSDRNARSPQRVDKKVVQSHRPRIIPPDIDAGIVISGVPDTAANRIAPGPHACYYAKHAR